METDVIRDRIIKLRNLFNAYEIDGYYVPKHSPSPFTMQCNLLQYISGFTGSNGCAFITDSLFIFLTDGRYRTQASQELYFIKK